MNNIGFIEMYIILAPPLIVLFAIALIAPLIVKILEKYWTGDKS